jgi:hypothetical protein
MVERTPTEIVELALALHTPENWEPFELPPFMRHFQPIICSTGTVCGIGRANSVTLVRHRRAIMWVHWHANTLPPGVKIGASASFIGKLITFNRGHNLQVNDALLLKKSPRHILTFLVKTLPDLIVNPEDYLTEEDDDLADLDVSK